MKILKYLDVAQSVSALSKDVNTKVGCILVDPDDKSIVGVGYNGPVRGAIDDIIPQTRPEKYEYFIHAELNLVANCARHGIVTKGKILYSTHSPCKECVRTLYQAGITKVYFKNKYSDFDLIRNMIDVEVEYTNCALYGLVCLSPKKLV